MIKQQRRSDWPSAIPIFTISLNLCDGFSEGSSLITYVGGRSEKVRILSIDRGNCSVDVAREKDIVDFGEEKKITIQNNKILINFLNQLI